MCQLRCGANTCSIGGWVLYRRRLRAGCHRCLHDAVITYRRTMAVLSRAKIWRIVRGPAVVTLCPGRTGSLCRWLPPRSYADWVFHSLFLLCSAACCRGEVTFSGVTLRYNPRQVALLEVDLHLTGGEHVSICGRTGAIASSAPTLDSFQRVTSCPRTRHAVDAEETLCKLCFALTLSPADMHRRWEVEPGCGAVANDASD